MKILLIEDDVILGESLVEFLTGKGFDVRWIQDDRQVEYESFDSYDVVILDLILKFSRGEEIISLIKKKNPDLPVLVVTAKHCIDDKEECFRRGADDYLTKPFDPRELLWRIKALCRRKSSSTVVVGDVEIFVDKGVLKKKGKEIKLSKTAWKLLTFLLNHEGEVVSKERILSYVWGDKIVGEEVLRAYIKELRKILPKKAIETYRGRGYCLKL